MKILLLSDLHLEFAGNRDFVPAPAAVDACDVIVLAGDIHNGPLGIEWAARAFPRRPVVYVAGNHEYYESDWASTRAALRTAAAASANVRLLDDGVTLVGGVRFLGATLWTDFALFGAAERARCEAAATEFIADFRLIRRAPEAAASDAAAAAPVSLPLFTTGDSIRLHEASRAFLEAELARTFAGPTVVVTHHLPSARSNAERFRTLATSAAFASVLDDLVVRGRAAAWLHGHTHDSFDYRLGATRIVCNPMGYPRRSGGKENANFDPGLIVEV